MNHGAIGADETFSSPANIDKENSFISTLYKLIKAKEKEISKWFKGLEDSVIGPIYASIDIRNSGYKVAPIDENVFPAGFNNLSDLSMASRLIKEYFSQYGDVNVNLIALVPENHTRNKWYLENIYTLQKIIVDAGFDTVIGSLNHELFVNGNIELETARGHKIKIYEVQKADGHAMVGDKVPDVILANNDFSSGKPWELTDVIQPIDPPIEMGWYLRRKNQHQEYYEVLVKEFSEFIGIDWEKITPITEYEKDVDFKNKVGLDRIAKKVDDVVAKMVDRGISSPFVYVKSNYGTYGMNSIIVRSGEDVLNMNSSQRKSMDRGKDSQKVTEVLIQEAIPTLHNYNGDPAEPVVYSIGNKIAGTFFRVGVSNGIPGVANLNKPGQKFVSVDDIHISKMETYVFNIIARIGSFAAGYEMYDKCERCDKKPCRLI